MNESTQLLIESVDLAGIERLARCLLDELTSPLVIGLVGTLGAGKTSLVQAIARSAGIDDADVTSPTFTLLQTHRGSVTLHHLDAYRVADEDEFLELGVDELFEDAQAWTMIEWADRVESVMPTDTLWIEITIEENDDRVLRFTVPNSKLDSVPNSKLDLLRRVKAKFEQGIELEK